MKYVSFGHRLIVVYECCDFSVFSIINVEADRKIRARSTQTTRQLCTSKGPLPFINLEA